MVPTNISKLEDNTAKVGDKVTLKLWQQARDESGRRLEKFTDFKEKTYTIVGIIDDYNKCISNAMYYDHEELISYMNDSDINENINVEVKFKSSEVKNWDKITGNIIDADSNEIKEFYFKTDETTTEDNAYEHIKKCQH